MSVESKSAGTSPELESLERGFMGHPQPLRSLFFTEMWERFSYYSIRPLLILFMVAAMSDGGLGFDDATAPLLLPFMVFLPAPYILLLSLGAGWPITG